VRYTRQHGGGDFSLATKDTWGGRDGAERQERTEWHNIVVWARQAEIAAQYIRKGKQLFVEGRLQTRDWVDPQGVKHFKTEIICRNFQMLGRRDETSAGYEAPGPQPPEDVDEYDISDLGPPLTWTITAVAG
jgi:single-strand DNA-binding protein